jgi:hypothetical protein
MDNVMGVGIMFVFTRETTSAFCFGETRQAMTATQ